MGRARFQEGSLLIRGKGPSATYYVMYRVYGTDGKPRQKKETIGLVSEIGKREANRRKNEIVAARTMQLKAPGYDRGATTMREFWDDRFLPMKSHWTDATREGYDYIMNRFVLPKFGDTAIDSIDKVMVQSLLNSLETRYSFDTVRHVRGTIVEILEEAVDQEFIIRNPATKTKVPAGVKKAVKPVLTPALLLKLISAITDERDKALFLSATFCAFRASEVFGLPWRNFHHNPKTGDAWFMVDQIAYRGKLHRRTKNKASNAPVYIGRNTLEAILAWREKCKDTNPDSLIFQSNNKNGRSKPGNPMCPSAFLKRRIQPIASKVGINFKVNFRATRRTAATLAQEAGVSLASAQGILRHSDPNTTARVYTKTIQEHVKKGVSDYETLIYSGKKASKKTG